MATTKIEWAERVWNPVTGCTKISPACANCYAERMAKRLAGRCGYPAEEPFKVTLQYDKLSDPDKWKKPARIFVCSMADLFHNDVPVHFLEAVFNIMLQSDRHTFLLLTKRPERMKWFIDGFETRKNTPWPAGNIWLGVTAENQEQADKRIPLLLQTPAAVRFVSVEPMLGPVDLTNIKDKDGDTFNVLDRCAYATATDGEYHDIPNGLDWVICGGENGPGARPMHPDWARSLRDQCQAAGVPFFFKGWGEFVRDDYLKHLPPGSRRKMYAMHEPPYTGNFVRVGKKAAGRLFDGVLHDEYPR